MSIDDNVFIGVCVGITVVVVFLMVLYFSRKPKKGNMNYTKIANDVSHRNMTKIEDEIHVTDVTDIINVIKQANRLKLTVAITGASHTMGGQTITKDGYRISIKNFNRILDYNDEANEITVQSGCTWLQIIQYLDSYNKRVHTQQSYSTFTVGGSIGPNCHGISSDDALIASIISFKIVNYKSEIIECSRTENFDLFRHVVGGYGLFGVITEVKLKVSDNCTTNVQLLPCRINNFVSMYRTIVNNPRYPIKIARINVTHMEEVQLYLLEKTDLPIKPMKKRPNKPSTFTKLMYKWIVPTYTFQRFRYCLERILGKSLDFVNGNVTCNQFLNETAEHLSKLYCPLFYTEDTHILQEFFIPEERFAEWMEHLQGLRLSDYVYNKLLNITIRYVNKDDITVLSYAKTNVLAFVFYWRSINSTVSDNELELIHHNLCDKALSLDGNFYLPYRHHYNAQQLEKGYPQMRQFIDAKNKYDPNGIFSNNWYKYCVGLINDTNHIQLNQLNPSKDLTLTAMMEEGTSEKSIHDDINETDKIKFAELKPTHEFQKIINSSNEMDHFKMFLDNIFHVVEDADAVLNELKQMSGKNDQYIFQKFKEYIVNYKNSRWFGGARMAKARLDLLSFTKSDISSELIRMCKNHDISTIDGLCVIGEPGKYVRQLMSTIKVKGKIWIVNDYAQFTDFIERGQIRRFDKSIKSTEMSTIPTGSIDMVMCMIGLHHNEKESLDTIMNNINRVLRKNGHFMVREHDATDDIIHRAHCAHIIFNAFMEVSDEDEIKEYRNFHPLKVWRQYIEGFGFKDYRKYLIQQNDPTRDFMMLFQKTVPKDLKAEYDILPHRNMNSTLFTLPEWYTIFWIDTYGEFLKKDAWYLFPYLRTVMTYWTMLSGMCKMSYKKVGLYETIMCDGFLMDSVIGIIFTSQIITLSALAVIPRWVFTYAKEDTRLYAYIETNDLDQINKIRAQDIDVVQVKDNTSIIRIRRYKKFLEEVKFLIRNDINIINIAGNTQLHIKLLVDENKKYSIFNQTIFKFEKTYQYRFFRTDTTENLCGLINILELKKVFEYLEENDIQIIHLFDY